MNTLSIASRQLLGEDSDSCVGSDVDEDDVRIRDIGNLNLDHAALGALLRQARADLAVEELRLTRELGV